MKKPVIPVVSTGDSRVDNFASAVKESLDGMTGQLKNAPRLQPLDTSASLADLITAHNALLERLQGS